MPSRLCLLLTAHRVSSAQCQYRCFLARSGDGYGRGEGFVAIVLRSQQLSGGDDGAYAVVSGSAINQDGRSSGLTAPNGPSQTALVRCAPTSGLATFMLSDGQYARIVCATRIAFNCMRLR